ncbi:MAG: flavin reductase family protein, partial [Candidatus Helarchaeota archaeon]
ETIKMQAHRAIDPRHTVLVTTIDNEGKPNIITLAWTMCVSFKPSIVAISIAKNRYSLKLLQQVEEFVINVPSREIIKEVLYCGRNSGKNVDKFKETSLTALPAKNVQPPIIKECVGFLECQVIKKEQVGDHTVFFGKVLNSYVKKEYSIEKKGYDLEKVQLIYHLGGNSFTVNSSEYIDVEEWWK